MIEVALKGSNGSVEGWAGKGGVGNEGVFENEEIKRVGRGAASL
jgi:hypothetical protein